MQTLPTVICLMGPTASGKTALAIELAREFPIDIINVDSAQIYQGLDIGSGKPSLEIRAQFPHHLMDFLDPAQSYSAATFCEDATRLIQASIAQRRIPLLVGGTMMYFKALQQGLSDLPASDPDIRMQLEEEAQHQGLQALYQRLVAIDPVTAGRLEGRDRQRILRALEVFMQSGQPLSVWHEMAPRMPLKATFINIALLPVTSSRQALHDRIERRFDDMLRQGLVAEVKQLWQRGDLNLQMPSMRAVGYRQAIEYLSGDVDAEQMRLNAIAATRQLAKRQLTWLRNWDLSMLTIDFLAQDALDEIKRHCNLVPSPEENTLEGEGKKAMTNAFQT